MLQNWIESQPYCSRLVTVFQLLVARSSRGFVEREARSKSAPPESRGSNQARTGCPYSAESADRRPRGSPIQRAASTRSTCPCANSAVSPSTARDRAITRSTRAPTCSGASPPGHPSRKINQPGATLLDLLGRQSLVFAVVPLDQVGVDDGLIAQARQFAGLSCPLHRAAENKPKCFGARVPAASAPQAGGHCRSTECPSCRCAGH